MHKIKATYGRSKEASRERGLSETQPRMASAMMTMSQDSSSVTNLIMVVVRRGASVRDLRERERERERGGGGNMKSLVWVLISVFFRSRF